MAIKINSNNETIEFFSDGIIDQTFTEEIVTFYKNLLAGKIQPPSDLLVRISVKMEEDPEQDFDLVFLSYLALVGADFPTIAISIHYTTSTGQSTGKVFYQLVQHNNHYTIIKGNPLVKLYLDGKLYQNKDVKASESYLPPLFIDRNTLVALFDEPEKKNRFHRRFEKLAAEIGPVHAAKHAIGFRMAKKLYREKLGECTKWKSSDLCGLYLLDLISRLPATMKDLFMNKETEIPSSTITEQIGKLIKLVLTEEGVFSFTQMEIYCLSLLIRAEQFTNIPQDEKALQKLHPELFPKKTKRQPKEEKTEMVAHYLRFYEDNLRRVIQNCKNIAYGLMELAKNIVEHTASGNGMITGRIYDFKRLRRLKRVNPGWLSQFHTDNDFIDLNVIDAGRRGICSSYRDNLTLESEQYRSEGGDDPIKLILADEYQKDLNELINYKLNNFFDFNSVKLFHQINRIKARLGLLIFSQTILSERKAFVKVASNDFEEEYPVGYALFEKDSLIRQEDMGDFYRIGTNYNFIIPISTDFVYSVNKIPSDFGESSMPSSVFLELQSYDSPDGPRLVFPRFNDFDHKMEKYEKLDLLKAAVGKYSSLEIKVLDAKALSPLLTNSSDWVRFLANMQFAVNPAHELIIINMPPDLYVEIIKILTIFDRAGVGFWKDQRYALFFLPISHATGRDVPETGLSETDVFWFNSLLCGTSYQQFINSNLDIDLYHNNLMKVTANISRNPTVKAAELTGPLFSTGGKLLNFELLLNNDEGISFFEETTRSLVNMEIKDAVSWK